MDNILYFDLESNGLLDEVETIHCLSIRTNSGEQLYVGPDVILGVERLVKYKGLICGHNVIAYDIPALQKVYPQFVFRQDNVVDTLVLSRLLFADISDSDEDLIKLERLPKKLRGSMSLEAWGYRLGNYKGDFHGPWETYTDEMGEYCSQDTAVTKDLYLHLKAQNASEASVKLEHEVQWIIQRQVRRGICFNETKAEALRQTLDSRREEVVRLLKESFGSIYVNAGEFTPKSDNARMGYTGGCVLSKVEVQEFNPGSRDQIAKRLSLKYGWKPASEEFLTETGKPMINEDVLKGLDYKEVPLLIEFLTIDKRLGQLSKGDHAWLSHLKADGRIHGSVNTNGAVTGRMTHASPNLAQVPSVGSLYGPECRELFEAAQGYSLVGCDADALELRCLAHYMGRYDGGAYAEAVHSGDKSKGTDIHTLNQKAAGLPTRDNAKTFIYGWLYGAGDAKIGKIVGGTAATGKKLKQQFLKKVPAIGQLKDAVTHAVETKGFLVGLDGRKLRVRSAHSALNTLLQSAGALLMKQALVILDRDLQKVLTVGEDYEFVLNIHDEWQIEVKNRYHGDTFLPDYVAQKAKEAIVKAGEFFKFRIPSTGDARVGNNWKDTH